MPSTLLRCKRMKMKKITKLKICDWSLLAVAVMMLASSIQQEFRWLGIDFVLTHIVLGIAFFVLTGWHLQLHFQWTDWFGRLRKQKSNVTKWLAAFGALTLLTAIIATIRIFGSWQHSAIGGWHGKFGFVFIALAICHIFKRIKFYK